MTGGSAVLPAVTSGLFATLHPVILPREVALGATALTLEQPLEGRHPYFLARFLDYPVFLCFCLVPGMGLRVTEIKARVAGQTASGGKLFPAGK